MVITTEFETRYFEWLYSHIGSVKDPNPEHGYWLLAEQLHTTPFNWFVPNDDNRASDGVALRDDFRDEIHAWGPDFHTHDDCSMLEMLVALAQRMTEETDDLGIDDGVGEWCWRLLGHLGLQKFSDAAYLRESMGVEEQVQYVLTTLIERKYDADGKGGLFPLTHPQRDQRSVEIWYQMSDYILEISHF